MKSCCDVAVEGRQLVGAASTLKPVIEKDVDLTPEDDNPQSDGGGYRDCVLAINSSSPKTYGVQRAQDTMSITQNVPLLAFLFALCLRHGYLPPFCQTH